MNLFDTNVLIAAFCSWHQDHLASLATWRRCLSEGNSAIVAAHTLAEFYAVLTRLPPPHRLSLEDTYGLIEGNISNQTVIALSPEHYFQVISECRIRKISGGTVYDALIVKAAEVGQARKLVTLNPRHFERIVSSDLEVVIPSES